MISSLSFGFGEAMDKIYSPPKGTYSQEPQKGFVVDGKARAISFGFTIQNEPRLVVIDVLDAEGKVISGHSTRRSAIVNFRRVIKIGEGEKIVAAKVATKGLIASEVEFLVYKEP